MEPHIYTKADQGGWGHNWYILTREPVRFWKDDASRTYQPQKLTLTGHLPRSPREGDEFHVTCSASIARLVVVSVRQCLDPPDMFFADAVYKGSVDDGIWKAGKETQ